MQLKEGYLLRDVAGNHVVVPVGNLNFDGMITLNDTGVFIWKLLEKDISEETILDKLFDEYGVDRSILEKDLAVFLKKMKDAGLLKNEN